MLEPLHSRSHFQLGRPVGLVGRCGIGRLVGVFAAVRWRYSMDSCLRHGVCAPGERLEHHCVCSSILTSGIQDKLDDVSVGIRSTALLFGDRTRPVLTAFSASSLSLISYAGYLNGQGIPFFAGIGLAGWQYVRVLRDTNWDDRASCWRGFVRCGWIGAWISAGAAVDYALMVSDIL